MRRYGTTTLCYCYAISISHHLDVDFLPQVVDDGRQERSNWINKVYSNPRSSLCLYQALLVGFPGDSEAFVRTRQRCDKQRSLIHCILVRMLDITGMEMETSFVLQQSRCVLMLVNRLHILIEKQSGLPDFESMIEKLESYCWTHIGHAVDSVRNNVRNTLSKITSIIGPEQHKELVARYA